MKVQLTPTDSARVINIDFAVKCACHLVANELATITEIILFETCLFQYSHFILQVILKKTNIRL
jgi:hypothetical protein